MEREVINRTKNQTYGLNEIYTFYKKEYRKSLSEYEELNKMYSDLVDVYSKEIYTINNKLGIYEKDMLEADNIKLIKDKQGKLYSGTDGYILLLRGYYKKLYKAKLESKNYKTKVIKLATSFLSALEFKYIYKTYNFHMSNAVLMGYRKFYLGGSLGRITIDKFDNKGRKRGIDWGESNKIKAELLKQGKTLYKETKHEDGTKTNNSGDKWLITYNHKEFDAFWKWKSMSSSLVKTHEFKPTNYRPTIIYDDNGKQLTTGELEQLSTISDIKSFKLGNTQKSTIITNLDAKYIDRYNDEYELKDYKIDYKIDF